MWFKTGNTPAGRKTYLERMSRNRTTLRPGQAAPDFELEALNGERVGLWNCLLEGPVHPLAQHPADARHQQPVEDRPGGEDKEENRQPRR